MSLKTGDRVSFTGVGIVLHSIQESFKIQFDGCRSPNLFKPEDMDKFTVLKPLPKFGDKVEGQYGGTILKGTLIYVRKTGEGIIVLDKYEEVRLVEPGFTHCDD